MVKRDLFRNTTQGQLGVVVLEGGKPKGIVVHPGDTILLTAEEQELTANAPRDAAHNPLTNGALVCEAESQELGTRRPLRPAGERKRPEPPEEKAEKPEPEKERITAAEAQRRKREQAAAAEKAKAEQEAVAEEERKEAAVAEEERKRQAAEKAKADAA